MRRASAGAKLPSSRSGYFIWLFGGIEYLSQTQNRLPTQKEAVPLKRVGAYVINTSPDDRPAR